MALRNADSWARRDLRGAQEHDSGLNQVWGLSVPQCARAQRTYLFVPTAGEVRVGPVEGRRGLRDPPHVPPPVPLCRRQGLGPSLRCSRDAPIPLGSPATARSVISSKKSRQLGT